MHFRTFVGNLPSLVVADVEIVKLMMTREFPTFMNRAVGIYITPVNYNTTALTPTL